jgi:hypothetical protein
VCGAWDTLQQAILVGRHNLHEMLGSRPSMF